MLQAVHEQSYKRQQIYFKIPQNGAAQFILKLLFDPVKLGGS